MTTKARNKCSKSPNKPYSKSHIEKRLPDLTDFRKNIHLKGEPLSQAVIKGRG